MFFKKTFLVLLVLAMGSIANLYAMDSSILFKIKELSPDKEVIERAAFYTIHGFKGYCGCRIGANVTVFEGKSCITSNRGGILQEIKNTLLYQPKSFKS